MKRIVIGTDGSADAGAAIDGALELAEGLGAVVTFVYARTTPNGLLGEPYYQRELDGEIAHAREVVDEAMAKAKAAGVDADYEILDGPADDAVLGVAETHDADLIVVGSRGLGAMQRAIFGSVSRALVTRAQRPVLVVKDPSRRKPKRDHALVDDGAVLGR
jgi:nucleotide-binding universal stress UspA family protein